MQISKGIGAALAGSSAIRKAFEEGARLREVYGADKVFDFSIGNPDIEPPPEFHATIRELLDEKRPLPHGYMSSAGFPDVREAVAKKAGADHNVNLTKDNIIMCVGAAGGLNAVFKAILNPGDEVLVTKPYFMEYRAYVSNFNGVLVTAEPSPDFSLNIDAISKKLSPKTAVVLINSPHNPSGRVYPAADLEKLGALLSEHGKKTDRAPILLSDEPYREIVYDGLVVPPVLCTYRDSIVVTSYSKNLSLPGERIGYIAVNPEAEGGELMAAAITYATRILGFISAPALAQRAVGRLTHIKAPAESYAKRRAIFMEILDRVGLEYTKPEGAFYLWVKVPDGDDMRFGEALKKNFVFIVPGTAFEYPGYIRFAYCVDEKVIRAAESALKKTVDEY